MLYLHLIDAIGNERFIKRNAEFLLQLVFKCKNNVLPKEVNLLEEVTDEIKIKIIDGTFFIVNIHPGYILDSSNNLDEIVYESTDGNYFSIKNRRLINVYC